MKKLLALFLCLLMLASLLIGCQQPPDADDSGDSSSAEGDTTPVGQPLPEDEGVLIDVSKYAIIRVDSPTPATPLLTAIVQLKKDIDSLTSSSIRLASDWLKDGTPDDAAFEILIGNTNRPQSNEVLSTLSGTGYVIRQVGNKIVIVGTNDAITADAVAYFYNTYVVPNAQSGGFKIPAQLDVVKDDYKLVQMIQNKKCIYDVVYNDGLDAVADDKGKVDYQVQLAKDIRQKIIDLTDANVRLKTDWVKPGTETEPLYEILVGTTERPESEKLRAELGVNEYGFKLIGNKIVITGWNEQSIGFAVDAFKSFLEESAGTAADGSKNISFLGTTTLTKSYSRWTVDIPEYEGGKLEGCVTCNNDQLEYYYTGTTAEEYRAYRQKLESEGYKLYCENEIAGNLYATYTTNSTMIHVYFVKHNGTVRLITGSMRANAKLPTNVSGAPTYEKITESKVTQMMLQYDVGNFGMCYIITLEDGSFIVFDSGGYTSGVSTDYVRLYNLLDRLNERKDGKIVIAAWIITHPHWDHHEAFFQMCKTYGKKLTIEQCIANTPDSTVYHNSNNPDSFMDKEFTTAASQVGGMQWIKPHTGMKFWVRNAEIEVLYTQEDLYPTLLNTFNDSSMVTRMTIAGQTITWLGDVQTAGSDVMVNMYGDYLKSDIVQVAHHGSPGATQSLYKLLSPSILLWPTSAKSYSSQTAGKSQSSHCVVDYYIAKNLGVTDIFVADGHNICLPLPYTPGSGKAINIDVAAG